MTLHILWTAVSWHVFLWPTASEWHCTFSERQSHHIFLYDQQQVSDIAYFVKGSLITSCLMTNSEWVTLHILRKAVSWHLFLWPTGCEWHCTFCERWSHQIFFYGQQKVSDIAHFVEGSLITSFPLPNSLWVTLHILRKVVSSHVFLWPTGSEWHCTFCEWQSYCIFSYDQQFVSTVAKSFTFILNTPQFMNVWHIVTSYLYISDSEYVAISFPQLPFTLLAS